MFSFFLSALHWIQCLRELCIIQRRLRHGNLFVMINIYASSAFRSLHLDVQRGRETIGILSNRAQHQQLKQLFGTLEVLFMPIVDCVPLRPLAEVGKKNSQLNLWAENENIGMRVCLFAPFKRDSVLVEAERNNRRGKIKCSKTCARWRTRTSHQSANFTLNSSRGFLRMF